MERIKIYTDGSTIDHYRGRPLKPPYPGGWAALIFLPNIKGLYNISSPIVVSGFCCAAKTLIVEIEPIIRALELLSQYNTGYGVSVYSDCQCIAQTMNGYQKWDAKKPEINDQWEKLAEISSFFPDISYYIGNRSDKLHHEAHVKCRREARSMLKLMYMKGELVEAHS